MKPYGSIGKDMGFYDDYSPVRKNRKYRYNKESRREVGRCASVKAGERALKKRARRFKFDVE